jgi:hypothetical protein
VNYKLRLLPFEISVPSNANPCIVRTSEVICECLLISLHSRCTLYSILQQSASSNTATKPPQKVVDEYKAAHPRNYIPSNHAYGSHGLATSRCYQSPYQSKVNVANILFVVKSRLVVILLQT